MKNLLLSGLLGLFLCGCESRAEPQVSAPQERSQIVAAKNDAAAPPAPPAVVPVVASGAPKAPRALCVGQMAAPGRPSPKKSISQRVAPGEAPLSEALPFGGGYRWVNFWAAWCKPCKEEIPRLQRFARELATSSPGFELSFVSLDDDERQLDAFLKEQPPSGLRRSYWLKEGKEREDWLKSAGLEADPDLPFHLLFDAKGKLRCVVKGALEDADLPALKTLLAKD